MESSSSTDARSFSQTSKEAYPLISESRTLRPIEADIVETMQGTISTRPKTQEIAAEARKRKINAVYFVGVGGSWASSVPAATALLTDSRGLDVQNINAADLLTRFLTRVDEKTLVVATSHSGNTPETVAAAEAAAAQGALVVSLARDTDNPLAKAADLTLGYGSDITITPAKYAILEELVCSLHETRESELDIIAVRSALELIPAATLSSVELMESSASKMIPAISDAKSVMVVGGGRMLGLAYMLANCYLIEMQWKPSTYINSADFFHGPFELIDESTGVIHIAGEDESRPLDERVGRFLDAYAHASYTADSTLFALEGVPAEMRGKVAHIPMAAVVARIASYFEVTSGHDLDTRRYMHKFAY